jgi:DnaJ-class molecular chaperone
VKKVPFTRKLFNQTTNETKEEQKFVTVSVKKGYRSGTQLSFMGEGDDSGDKKRKKGNVVVILYQKQHKTYVRDTNDLYSANLSFLLNYPLFF